MSDGLTVVRIIARLNVGGPARHCAVLARGLAERGHHTVLAFGTADAREGSLEALVGPGSASLVRLPELGRRIRPWSDFVALLAIVRLLRAHRPDVIHTHTAKAGTLGRIAAALYNRSSPRSRRAVVVHTFHGHVFEGYFGRLGSLLVTLVERALARVTDRVVTISDRQRHDIVERFGVARADQTVVLPLGLPLESFLEVGDGPSELRRELGIGPGAFVVGFVGRLVPIKSPAILLDAFDLVAAALPDAHLLIVGDGPLRAVIDGRAAHSRRIHALGWRHDLENVYAATDAVALTSRNEGTPVAIIEAMAAARPVAASSVGGVPDVVEHEVSGLLVPPGDPAATAAALIRLAGDPVLRRRLGAAGRERVAARYGAERLVAETEALYRQALQQVRSGPVRARRHDGRP